MVYKVLGVEGRGLDCMNFGPLADVGWLLYLRQER